MKKIIIVATLCSSLTLNIYAQEVENHIESDTYKNIRESNSHYISVNKEEEINRVYKGSPEMDALRKIITDSSINNCASKVVSAIQNELNLKSEDEIKLAILSLRLDESIDDVVANILIKSSEHKMNLNPITKDDLSSEEESMALDIYKAQVSELKNKKLCIEDSYRALVSKLTSSSYKFTKNLKHINKLALNHNIINNNDFKIIERMRKDKVHSWPITLSDYKSNLDSIAKAFPNRKKESSKLVTAAGRFRSKTPLRQGLYEKFNTTQIILLANVVKTLKQRLDSNDVSIHINYVDQKSEIINLSPMEKFRFILKLLRKELSAINNGSILNGQQATYFDIITAAYEVGYISASEIDQLAGLEDIWNPKKTTKEKIMVWGKLFGGIASILLPPPFGFISVMAIMLIDQQVSEAPIDSDSDYNLM
jgi:hypothetical protein